MGEPIGIRLPGEVLKQIEKVSEEENEDRSSVIRKLVMLGYKDFMRKKAAEAYKQGLATISEAAHRAGMTIWEMEEYLIGQGFKSSYSVDELEKEIKMLEK